MALRLLIALTVLFGAASASLHSDDRILLDDRERFERDLGELILMYSEQRAALTGIGPMFEFRVTPGAMLGGPVTTCLIGKDRQAHIYVIGWEAGAQTTSPVSQRDYERAANLAKSLGHVKWQPQSGGFDGGVFQWIMSFDGASTLLEVIGDDMGALPDTRASELVKLIDGWCPYAQEARLRMSKFSR